MRHCPKCETDKPDKEFHYKKNENRFNSWCKRCVYDGQMLRWQTRKVEAVRHMGGVCSECSYSKNYAAFHFHHLDPSQKEFQWNKLRLRKWDDVLRELSKCKLLCGNCHTETHYPEMDASNWT